MVYSDPIAAIIFRCVTPCTVQYTIVHCASAILRSSIFLVQKRVAHKETQRSTEKAEEILRGSPWLVTFR